MIGHGGSVATGSGHSIKRQAALVAAILDRLGTGKLPVIGHSMVERLILTDSPADKSVEFNLLAKAYLTRVPGQLMPHFRTDALLRKGLA